MLRIPQGQLRNRFFWGCLAISSFSPKANPGPHCNQRVLKPILPKVLPGLNSSCVSQCPEDKVQIPQQSPNGKAIAQTGVRRSEVKAPLYMTHFLTTWEARPPAESGVGRDAGV